MGFWTRYRKNAGPEYLSTTVRISIDVDPHMAAHAALSEVGPGLTPEQVEHEVSGWSATKLREAVVSNVRDRGTGEYFYLWPTESIGYDDDHVQAAQRAVIKAGISDEDYARVFGAATGKD